LALALAVPGCRAELPEAALLEALADWFLAQGIDDQGRRFAWRGEWSGEGTRPRTRVVPLSAAAGGAP
jgi:hypothetical protein